MINREAQILRLAKKQGVLRSRDLQNYRISREYLRRMCRKGVLTQTARGLYEVSGQDYSGQHGLAEVTKKVPGCIICLLSALQYHEIGTELPARTWIGVRRGSWRPTIEYPPLEVITCNEKYMSEGVEVQHIDGVDVRITGIARTVADVFKFRNKIGLDVAIQALRDVLSLNKCTVGELSAAAKLCRVERIIRPYIEAFL